MRGDRNERTISSHIRANVVAYVAVFLALGGSAYANHPFGNNSIDSGDIIDKTVAGIDIKQSTLKSGDIKDGELTTDDIDSGAVTSSKIGNGEVKTLDVQDNGLTGHDVNESTLVLPPASDLNCSECVGSDDIGFAALTLSDFGFDPATQTELNALADFDGTPPNQGTTFVHWNKLGGMPTGFADGVDDTGGGGGWSLTGNAGTNPATNFLGTTDNVALNLRVNNARGLRLEPASDGTNVSPNVIGGIVDNLVTAGAFAATIGGGGRLFPGTPGSANEVTDDFGTISGGANNQAGDNAGTVSDKRFATVGGGVSNLATGAASTVSAGTNNTATADRATVGGGANNQATADRATVAGGGLNLASGLFATVGGGESNTATATHASVAGGNSNDATNASATVSGGNSNTASNSNATVGGGTANNATGGAATVGGGFTNTASGGFSTVAGGDTNTAGVGNSSVGGGLNNNAIANAATVAGGQNNVASGNHSAVLGGAANIASGLEATVGGGDQNAAAGDFSFVAGKLAKNTDAAHDGVFLFADSNSFNFTSTVANEFAVRSIGGARVVTAIDGTTGNPTAGVKLDPGDTAWEVLSDRAAKENVVPISPEQILERLATVPITQWNYKAQDDSIRHIGPMAQDFHRAFGLSGEDRTHLSPIDTDGVALAAIQGLNERFEELGGHTPANALPPAALAAIALLALPLTAALGAALALGWSGRTPRSASVRRPSHA